MSEETVPASDGDSTRKLPVWAFVVIGLLAVAAIVGWVFAAINWGTIVELETEVAAHEDTISDVEAQLDSAESDIVALEGDKADLEGDLSEVESDLADTEDELAETEESLAEVQVGYEGATEEVAKYQEMIECSYDYTVPEEWNFNSQASISADLSTYIGEWAGSVVTANWDVLWNNARPAMHMITTEDVLHIYLVYFDETDYGFEQSIFSVRNSCFVNLDQNTEE